MELNKLGETVPPLHRGQVRSRECNATRREASANCLSAGWPKCCGYTMTIDSPEEQQRFAEAAIRGKDGR